MYKSFLKTLRLSKLPFQRAITLIANFSMEKKSPPFQTKCAISDFIILSELVTKSKNTIVIIRRTLINTNISLTA